MAEHNRNNNPDLIVCYSIQYNNSYISVAEEHFLDNIVFTRDIKHFCFRKKSFKYQKIGCNLESFKIQDRTQPIQFAFNATDIITSENENILRLHMKHIRLGTY